MQPTRLTRLLALLTLMRRAACLALLALRECQRSGDRARLMREQRHCRRLRDDIRSREADAVRRLTALTALTRVMAN